MAITLRELLERKATPVIYVKASMSALQAIEIMCDKQVGSLLIESDGDSMLGIATERDILRFCASHDGTIGNALIGEVMTRELAVATPEWTIEEAMSVMTEQHFRHLPVVEGGVPIGMISIGDLVKAELKDVTVEVKYLRDFISA